MFNLNLIDTYLIQLYQILVRFTRLSHHLTNMGDICSRQFIIVLHNSLYTSCQIWYKCDYIHFFTDWCTGEEIFSKLVQLFFMNQLVNDFEGFNYWAETLKQILEGFYYWVNRLWKALVTELTNFGRLLLQWTDTLKVILQSFALLKVINKGKLIRC